MKGWTNWRKDNYKFFARELAGEDKKKKLLDLGAGPCQFAKVFKQFSYTGVDSDPYPDVVVADLTKELPFGAGTFDIVTASNVLEHMPNPENLLKEIQKVLSPRGIVVGTVPFIALPHQEPRDYFRYTHHGLRHLLSAAGFSNIEVTPIGFPLMPKFSFLPKILRRRVQNLYMRFSPSITLSHCEGYGFKATK